MTPLMTYLVIFIAIVIVAGIAVGIYYAVKEDSDDNSSSPTPSPAPDDIVGPWVAVGAGNGGNVLYSINGLCWQESTGARFQDRGYGVAYGTSNGTSPLWVAAGNDGNGAPGRGNIMYSADGISWQESTGLSFSSEAIGVAYGTSDGTNPLWVAVGTDTNFGNGEIMYSENGIEWLQKSTGASWDSEGYGVAYGTSNGTSPLWVAVGGVGSNEHENRFILYSENGKEWQESTGMSFVNGARCIAYGTSNGTSPLWAVGGRISTAGAIFYSENGKAWQGSSTDLVFSERVNGLAYGTSNGTSPLWVAVGNIKGPNKGIKYSEDGKEWQNITGTGFQFEGKGVAYGTSNGTPLWVAVGTDTNSVVGPGKTLYSTNGKEWQEPEDPNIFSLVANGVAFKSILPNVPNFY